jgi:endogenous inhibitor of DNA gyrase (YacG/DUF329 family)
MTDPIPLHRCPRCRQASDPQGYSYPWCSEICHVLDQYDATDRDIRFLMHSTIMPPARHPREEDE